MHARFGYQHVGTMHRVGRKFGRYWDVTRFQRMMSSGANGVQVPISRSTPDQRMDNNNLSQLITAGSALTGVVLTLFANTLLDRSRARDARRIEADRIRAQQSVWMRDERRKAYSDMSSAGEDVMHFL